MSLLLVLKKIKYRKIAVVVFLTVLIWVWADLALDEILTVPNTPIRAPKVTDPRIWVSFGKESTVYINNFALKGPASKISNARRGLSDGTISFDFTLDNEQEGMVNPDVYSLPVLPFLRKNYMIQRLGLTVESCDPESFTVNVEELVQKPLTVQCVDESGLTRTAQSIVPSQVDMYVPRDWGRERLIAQVVLSDLEIKQAGTSEIPKTPFIDLGVDQRRQSPVNVMIKMPPEEDPLKDFKIINAKIGFCYSTNTQGKYRAEVSNLNEVIASIAIRATPEAKQIYESMQYHVELEIYDEDVKNPETRREVKYNFPQKYVREGKIELAQPPVTARFSLIPINSTDGP